MKLKINQFILILTIIIPIFISGIIFSEAKTHEINNKYSTELLTKGTSAPDWTLKEVMTDQTMTFSSFEGKVVLIDFFATWCGPCETSIPNLITVRNTFSTSKLTIISIDTDPASDSEATVESFVTEKNMNWFIFRDTESISSDYQISNIPTFYIIDQNQAVYFSRAGIVESNTLIYTINQLIGSPTTSNPSNNDSVGISDFWQKNWYWIIIVVVFGIVGAAVLIQRQRVVNHNKMVQQQKLEQKKRRSTKRKR